MDYGLIFLLAAVSVGGLAGGSLITLGLIEAVTGRTVINRLGAMWSEHEARLLGLCRVFQGVAVSTYPLIGALTLGPHMLPTIWVGHSWGIFVSVPFVVVMLGTLFFQASLELRRERRGPASRDN